MTRILIPREPSTALLRPFIGCQPEELTEAYAAMVRIAEVQHARAGRSCLAQIEEPAGAAPAAVAGPAPKGWRLVPATPTREWIAAVADGVYEDCDCASLIADILSSAPAAPALEAPAATTSAESNGWRLVPTGRATTAMVLAASHAHVLPGASYSDLWTAMLAAAPQAPAAPAVDASDTALLDALAAESMDLRCFDMPTGQGDADVGWRVIQHHMGEPVERVVSEVYKDDPRSAIRAAIARLERDPYCTGPLHEEDAEDAAQAAAKGEIND